MGASSMVWDQLEAMGAGGNSCATLALCKTKTKQNNKKKKKAFPEMDFPLGAGISAGIYLSVPHLAMAHGLESTGK